MEVLKSGEGLAQHRRGAWPLGLLLARLNTQPGRETWGSVCCHSAMEPLLLPHGGLRQQVLKTAGMVLTRGLPPRSEQGPLWRPLVREGWVPVSPGR